MLSFWENGYFFYVAAAFCVWGALVKWLASRRYKRLIKQAETLHTAKDKQLKLLRGRFDNVCRVMGCVPNPHLFVEKSLLEYRLLWTSLAKADRICRQIGLGMLLIGGLFVYVGFRMGLPSDEARLQLLGVVAFAGALLIWDLMLDTREKKRNLVMLLCHYFENSPGMQMARPALAAQDTEPDAKLEMTRNDLEHMAAGREEITETPPARRRLSPEEETVIKEIIREYLA